MIKRYINVFKSNPIVTALMSSLVIVYSICLLYIILIAKDSSLYEILKMIPSILIFGALIGGFSVFPVLLSIINLIYLFNLKKDELSKKGEIKVEVTTMIIGSLFMFIFLASGLTNITYKDWNESIFYFQIHTPIATEMTLTICIFILVAILGYLVLRFAKINNLSPLVLVLAMSALYIGVIVAGLWICQVFKISTVNLILILFPLNVIVIFIKVIKDVVIKWNLEHKYKERVLKDNKLINLCNKILNNALNWPWLALIFMVLLLGILIGILVLFGQAPDSVIKAFTETAEWNLSTKIPAQSLEYDGHYLCTVAAGGHKEIVKPIRLGRRGGKYIVVNRQLCIANAFEQIIEEKAPKFHYLVRSFYDKYGYPVAKHINSKYTADFVYFLMKPLEWIFLIVIYLFDNKPENRIAIQYLPKKK
ncbi:DUF6688 family protein [Clostridium sp. D43t1_170807_H7]|uniref:DUF6688 domain-containing protein n=1 Tax=Clostridium sp. D43t1_170807_H7 TaxID=2787140 RepID=UPI001896E088|nr:DUF6688 family protein [Clostridium sp. D43t1_170807_H7]